MYKFGKHLRPPFLKVNAKAFTKYYIQKVKVLFSVKNTRFHNVNNFLSLYSRVPSIPRCGGKNIYIYETYLQLPYQADFFVPQK